ncbi:hypothetical protein ACFSJW_03485 [Flavobacterium artemisiae]|uniref:Uncharacterized protein n=1 Tax=Flavobacterium artemisiae TaxID=2126556 RepID=A0ABW4HJ74_9FLAO
MKSLNILIILFLVSSPIFSQDNIEEITHKKDIKIDSIVKIDFISYKYKYLDENLKIKIPKELYEKMLIDSKLNPERIKKYSDSLEVILKAEFNDDDAARIAQLRITYSWERVGLHIWKNKDEVIEIAKKLNIKHPYRLQELFLNNDSKVSMEIQNLRITLYQNFGKVELMMMPTKQLMPFAFSNNPEIIERRNNHHKNLRQRK